MSSALKYFYSQNIDYNIHNFFKKNTLLESFKALSLQLELLSVLGKAEWLSWCLGRKG